ncbi:MAG TPA: hypothetical protein VEB68_06165 [Croceibacterium sp.]|nr:hypothetical protein [Croceibacterium sp.]
MTRAAAAALAAAVAALPAAAQACSVAADYRVPGNLELARAAETIVVARVIGGATDRQGDAYASTITVRPLATIKGAPPQGDIALQGMTLAEGAAAGLGGLSNPYEFARPHPLGLIGGCIRYVFPRGTTALFFLRTGHEGMWAAAGEPFSRWAEDVPDENAPWVALTRLYVRAAELAPAERTALLEAERAALLARLDEPVAQLMAADIARQLGESGEAAAAAPAEDPFIERSDSAVDAALRAMQQAAEEGAD